MGLASCVGSRPALLAAFSSLFAATRSRPLETVAIRVIGLYPLGEWRAFASFPGFGISTTL